MMQDQHDVADPRIQIISHAPGSKRPMRGGIHLSPPPRDPRQDGSRSDDREEDNFSPADQLSLLKSYFDSKFDEMQQGVAPPKPKQAYEYKNKYTRVQGQHLETILEGIDLATSHLTNDRPSLKRAIDALDDVRSVANKRLKHVRIADGSEAGWATIDFYDRPVLGSDEEDDKKIRAAERQALAVRKKKAKDRTPSSTISSSKAESKSFPHDRSSTDSRSTHYGRESRSTDVCLKCGGTGHWSRVCPTNYAPQGKSSDSRYVSNIPISPDTVSVTEHKPSPKGRLKAHSEFWENTLKASPTVMNVIREGYKIPFHTPPQPIFHPNNSSALAHPDFVSSEIQGLLTRGCIKQVSNPPFVVNPLSVATNSSKLRLILDLRHVNSHIPPEFVRFDDWRVFQHFLTEGCWLYKFDLSSGYHHIDIHSSSSQFRGFSWSDFSGTNFYVFTVLPFGLSSAPRVFTNTLRPLSAFWHERGIKIAVYIDDGGGVEDSGPLASKNSAFVHDTLIRAGFLVNTEKSVWDPTQVLLSTCSSYL